MPTSSRPRRVRTRRLRSIGNSVPRLANAVYFIGFAVPPAQRQIEGTLSVEMRRSGDCQGVAPGTRIRVCRRVRPRSADGPADPPDNRHGPVQDRFERDMAHGQSAGMGPWE